MTMALHFTILKRSSILENVVAWENSKSKKFAKTMISIHFKVGNCQVVLLINVTKLSSEDRTGLG